MRLTCWPVAAKSSSLRLELRRDDMSTARSESSFICFCTFLMLAEIVAVPCSPCKASAQSSSVLPPVCRAEHGPGCMQMRDKKHSSALTQSEQGSRYVSKASYVCGVCLNRTPTMLPFFYADMFLDGNCVVSFHVASHTARTGWTARTDHPSSYTSSYYYTCLLQQQATTTTTRQSSLQQVQPSVSKQTSVPHYTIRCILQLAT
jgi:hypothetical protein